MTLAVRSIKTFLANPVQNTPRLFRNFRHFISDSSFSQIRPAGETAESAYKNWIEKYDFQEAHRAELEDIVTNFKISPIISIIIPVYRTPLGVLTETIASIKSQIYSHWEVCICIDGEADPEVIEFLEGLCSSDSRFKCAKNAQNMGIAAATNRAFSLVTGEWTTFLDHDDLLRPHSLAECVRVIQTSDKVKLIYSDEDKIDDEGQRFDPYFKCDYSEELILSMNYFNHLTVIKSDEISKAGVWNSQLDGAQDYDMVLRVLQSLKKENVAHIPKILYHWRASKDSEALTRNVKEKARAASVTAVENYLQAKSYDGSVETCEHSGYNRVKLALRDTPKVSIIIPTRNQASVLEKCVSSIFQKTTYSNFEIIIIDNGSDDEATKSYLAAINQKSNVRVLEYDKPFNYSEINNYAVGEATGDIICLLNNDTEVMTTGWLSEMLPWLMVDGVGCVGAKLLYPNNTVQHAGVILGIAGIAGHSHKYFPKSKLGYYGRLAVVQNFSAVTAACMMFRKADFISVDGLNAKDLAVSYNDVDLWSNMG